jgi:hypothetical protein
MALFANKKTRVYEKKARGFLRNGKVFLTIFNVIGGVRIKKLDL